MYLRIVRSYRHTNIVSFIQTKKTMNTIKIAAELLAERAKKTTDATAFVVTVEKDKSRILLTPDSDRRGGSFLDAFYHMEDVVSICRPLKLSFWIAARTYADENGNIRPTFEVDIY